MGFYITGAGVFFVLWVVYKQVNNWFEWRALNKWGDQYGCVEAPAVPNKLPGGLERYSILFTGLKGLDVLEDLVRKRYTDMKNTTHRQYNLFNTTLVSTCEPENIKAVLATKFEDWNLGPARSANFSELIGNGIFTADGHKWAHFRAQLKPTFARDHVSDLETADRHLQILFKALPEENADGWVEGVDIKPLIYRFTMDTSTEFLFGHSVNSQTTNLHSLESGNATEAKEELNFSDAMTYAQDIIVYRLRLRSLYWLASTAKFKKACKTVHDFADRFVKLALDPSYKRNSEKFILLDALLDTTRDPIELRDQILQVLLAGRDTTSALMSWVILLLARDPAQYKKLRDIITSQFGTEDNPTTELTFSSLKSCKHLTHVLYETLRLYPLVPLNGRKAVRDTVLPSGGGKDGKQPIAIMKGEELGYSVYVMQRRHDIWGEDADEFRPERWEGRKLGWEFVPFSGGPRVCLGQQYALNEASFVLAKMLQRYDRIEALDRGKIRKSLTLTLAPAGGVKIKLHRAAS